MNDLTHATTGAAIGYKVGNPILAFIFAIIFHLILDKIPHFWPGLQKNKRYYVIANYIFIIGVLVYILNINLKNQTGIIFGAIGGLIVDIILVIIPPIYKSKLGKWHNKRQIHSRNILYIWIDLAITALALVILFYF
jgi:hypothetical protein